ncbi:MAG TPA: beta-propeller fold lactonase family protein, partial [Chitinophagaceae bacterium]|nr:beta-propeller fold lactonase family protein [Chitinophagaceae bacterium]
MRFSLFVLALLLSATCFSQDYYLFVGPYTNNAAKGIYVYRFSASTGQLTPVSIAEGVENPSYLTLSPNGQYLYSVNQYHGEKPSSISAFSFDNASGRLHLINRQPADDGAAYISTDAAGKWVMVANYTAGSLQAYPIKADGSVGPPSQTITHTGHGVDTARQKS